MNEKPDLLVISRFKNLPLYDLCRGKNRKTLAKAIGINVEALYKLLNLTQTPYRKKDGEPTPSAVKVADYFYADVEELFPRSLYLLPLPGKIERAFPIPSERLLPMLEARRQGLLPQYASEESSPEFDAMRDELPRELKLSLETLTPREEKVIRMRFGLDGGLDGEGEHTLGEVASTFARQPERIRQIQARALRKLRHPSSSQRLRVFLDERHLPSDERLLELLDREFSNRPFTITEAVMFLAGSYIGKALEDAIRARVKMLGTKTSEPRLESLPGLPACYRVPPNLLTRSVTEEIHAAQHEGRGKR